MIRKVQAKKKPTKTKLDIIHIRSLCPGCDLVLWSEGGPRHGLTSSRSGPRKGKPAHWAVSSNPDRRTGDSDVMDRWKSMPLRARGAGMEEAPPHSKLGVSALP